MWTKTFNPDVNDEDFYRSLLMRMRSEIDLIEYDSHDEFGLLDEIVKVCNILSKYKHIIVLKRKKKTLLEKIIGS